MSIKLINKLLLNTSFQSFLNIIISIIFLFICSSKAYTQIRILSGTNLINTGSLIVKDIGIINNGTFNNSIGTIVFNGSENSTVGGNGENVFNNLIVNKTLQTAKVILSGDITLNGTLTLMTGDLDLYDNVLVIGPSASISGESNSNIIFSSFNNGSRGYLTTTRNYFTPLSSETFGNIGITLSTTVPTGNTTIRRYFDAAAIGINTGMSKQFSIVPAVNTDLNATMVMKYFGSECQGLNPSAMETYFSINGGTSWIRTTSTVDYNSETQSGTLTISGLSTFHDNNRWTASDDSHPLPVVLLSFVGSVNKRDVSLKWVTEREINNAGFEIQRALLNSGNLNWNKVGYVTGNGTNNGHVKYSFDDIKVNSGMYKYRLKQFDFNGNTEYFTLENSLEIMLPNSFTMGQNYPNPFNSSTKIEYQVPKDAFVNIKIFDITGRELNTIVNDVKEPGYYTALFDGSRFSSGVYFYRMTAGTFSKILKMTVLK